MKLGLGEMGGIGERKRSNFDQNTLHACMKFPNDKLIKRKDKEILRDWSPPDLGVDTLHMDGRGKNGRQGNAYSQEFLRNPSNNSWRFFFYCKQAMASR